jgi:hypothetical protein
MANGRLCELTRLGETAEYQLPRQTQNWLDADPRAIKQQLYLRLCIPFLEQYLLDVRKSDVKLYRQRPRKMEVGKVDGS